MIKDIKIEICCGSVDDCLVAEANHADRIELNSALELGGLTPSLATLTLAKQKTQIPLCCMVRPRTAGFVYTQDQIETMFLDAKILLDHGADGIVFGFLNKDNTIDILNTKKMVDLIKSYDKEAIFHKAFDECTDFDKASQDLIVCGVDRVLTSGGSSYPDLDKGCQIIGDLIRKYSGQLQYLPGGGVRAHNIKHILELTKADQIHMTAKSEYFDNGNYVACDDSQLKEILNQI